jgi:hypothetical protein
VWWGDGSSPLPLGGRALLPAVLLALACVGSAPATGMPAAAHGAVAAGATARPHAQQRRTLAVQPAANLEPQARRGFTTVAILGAGLALAAVVATAAGRFISPWRAGTRPLAPRPRAPPLRS